MTKRGSRVQIDARAQSDGPVQFRTRPDGRFDQPPGRSGGACACDRGATPPDMHAARGPDRPSSRSAGGLARRSELAALYLRAAGILDPSVQLAERHPHRTRANGLQRVTQIDLDRAKRARQGARARPRALAARYAQPDLTPYPSARGVPPWR